MEFKELVQITNEPLARLINDNSLAIQLLRKKKSFEGWLQFELCKILEGAKRHDVEMEYPVTKYKYCDIYFENTAIELKIIQYDFGRIKRDAAKLADFLLNGVDKCYQIVLYCISDNQETINKEKICYNGENNNWKCSEIENKEILIAEDSLDRQRLFICYIHIEKA